MSNTWKRLKSNPKLFKQYLVREKVIRAIHEYFWKKDYKEVEVPLLAATLPAESYVEVFETRLLDRDRTSYPAYLTTSPEIFLKKLLTAGIGNCFSITKSFRNTETFSSTHNPEFTLLEWYRTEADYKDLMGDTEQLFVEIYKAMLPKIKNLKLTYQGKVYDLTPPWERLSMSEAFKRYADMDLESALTLDPMKQMAMSKGYTVEIDTTWEELFHQIYLNEIEPHLGKKMPTIIYDFPAPMSALAKKKTDDPRFAERFELYIAGLELGDCYSELTDWKEQEERFIQETKERKNKNLISYPYDQDFIEALKSGMPKCAGLALGIDRVVMLFADVKSIQDTLFFPACEMWSDLGNK